MADPTRKLWPKKPRKFSVAEQLLRDLLNAPKKLPRNFTAEDIPSPEGFRADPLVIGGPRVENMLQSILQVAPEATRGINQIGGMPESYLRTLYEGFKKYPEFLKTAYAEPHQTTLLGTQWKDEIGLNPMLANASDDLLLDTLIHELTHARLPSPERENEPVVEAVARKLSTAFLGELQRRKD